MSDVNRYWDELTAAALVGTDRRPALPAPPPGALANLLGQLDAAEPAAALLDAAAAATLYRRAATLPALAPAAPVAPSPDDGREPCGPRAARHLRAVLGEHRPLLAEWLAALDAAGRRAPDGAAPALLEVARGEPGLRPAVARAVGSRGPWLAALNPDWAFAAAGAATGEDPGHLEARWQVAGRAERQALLATLRADQSALARALVASTWASEKADDRAAFVAALRVGLSMDDEPFLEAALDDRGKEVRSTAADLLAHLPGSRLAARMAERALPLLAYRGGLFPSLALSLPSACDKALQRDGVTLKPWGSMGERAWWLRGIVERTPPATWAAAWSQAPAAILRARVDAEWRPLLLGAWATAATAYGDVAWSAALVEGAATELEGEQLAALLQVLPAGQREPLLIRLLAKGGKPLGREHPALPALCSGGLWSPALARAVIEALARRLNPLKDAAYMDWPLRSALEGFALAIPPELGEEAIAVFPDELAASTQWGDAVRTFTERLRLRREMLAALRAGA